MRLSRLRRLVGLVSLLAILAAVGVVTAFAANDIVITFDQTPTNPTASTDATFKFHAGEGAVTFECQLDAAAPVPCDEATGFTTSGLTPGPHTFAVNGSKADRTGSATYSWTIDDGAPPTVTITPLPTDQSTSRTPTIAFEFSDDSPTTAECWVDDSPHQPACTSPYTTPTLADGPHMFHVLATDSAGNAGADDYPFTIDAPPTVTFTNGPLATTDLQNASFEFTSDDTAAIYTCALDDAPFEPCSSPKGYENLSAGPHTFKVRATDTFGNVGETGYTWTIVTQAVVTPQGVDVTPPDTADPLDYLVRYRHFELTWTRPSDADFSHVTVFRQTSGSAGRVAVYSGAATRFRDARFNNALDYRYQVISYDSVGNASPAVSVQIFSSTLLGSPRRAARVRRPPTLSWAAIPGARFYNVQLFRNGKKIMSTWPRRPRVRLAARWRYAKRAYALGSGRYDWYVWPAFRNGGATRYGSALGHSFFRR